MRRRCNYDCNLYNGAILPPCTEFLGSYNPLIKNGDIIYRNYNRLFAFITYNSVPSSSIEYDPCDPKTHAFSVNGNIQISLHDLLIGLFLNAVQKGNIRCDYKEKIHEDDDADKFIKDAFQSNAVIKNQFIPSITYIISNSNAIVPLYEANVQISPIIFYILFILNRLEGNYALLHGNNSYVTPDFINYELANLFVKC